MKLYTKKDFCMLKFTHMTGMQNLEVMPEKYKAQGNRSLIGKSLIIVSVNRWKHLKESRLINAF